MPQNWEHSILSNPSLNSLIPTFARLDQRARRVASQRRSTRVVSHMTLRGLQSPWSSSDYLSASSRKS